MELALDRRPIRKLEMVDGDSNVATNTPFNAHVGCDPVDIPVDGRAVDDCDRTARGHNIAPDGRALDEGDYAPGRDHVSVYPAVDGHDTAQGTDCVGNPAPDLRSSRGNGDASVDVPDNVEERRVGDKIAVDIAKDRHRAARNVEVAVDPSTSRNLHRRAGHELCGCGGTILPEQGENCGN
jgi:hypothetical protein